MNRPNCPFAETPRLDFLKKTRIAKDLAQCFGPLGTLQITRVAHAVGAVRLRDHQGEGLPQNRTGAGFLTRQKTSPGGFNFSAM